MTIGDVRFALGADDIAVAVRLFREYADSLEVDLCFQGFDEEVAGLPGDYALPGGFLLLAEDGMGEAIGCVGLRPGAVDGVGEVKRLYVSPAGRGLGLGRILMDRLIVEARGLGYRAVCLDTLPSMESAMKLYESMGFEDTRPAYESPVCGHRFMQLTLV